jgi:hypothetical protein
MQDLLSNVVRKRAEVQSPLAEVIECLEMAAGGLTLDEPQHVVEFIKRARERKPDVVASPVVCIPKSSVVFQLYCSLQEAQCHLSAQFFMRTA